VLWNAHRPQENIGCLDVHKAISEKVENVRIALIEPVLASGVQAIEELPR